MTLLALTILFLWNPCLQYARHWQKLLRQKDQHTNQALARFGGQSRVAWCRPKANIKPGTGNDLMLSYVGVCERFEIRSKTSLKSPPCQDAFPRLDRRHPQPHPGASLCPEKDERSRAVAKRPPSSHSIFSVVLFSPASPRVRDPHSLITNHRHVQFY